MEKCYLHILFFALLLLSACGSPPAKVATPTPSPSPTAYPVEAVKVDKLVNVSFSTYSKDWPVGWQWIDPEEKYKPTPHDVHMRVLRVRVPSKKDLFGENRSAPRYVKAITGDFQIETRVKFLPKENYQGAGLLIFKDDQNYIRFERGYGGVEGGTDGIRIDAVQDGQLRSIVTTADHQTEAGNVELKFVRVGKVFTAYWREDDESEWRMAGEFESTFPETILAGPIMCNTASEVTAQFDYIRLTPIAKK